MNRPARALHSPRNLPTAVVIALALAFSAAVAQGQLTWNAGGTDNLWTNPDNWVDGEVPQPDESDAVLLPDGSPASTSYNVELDRDQIIRGGFARIVRNSTFDLGGHSFTIDGGEFYQGESRINNMIWTNGNLVLGGASATEVNLLTDRSGIGATEIMRVMVFTDTVEVNTANVSSLTMAVRSGNRTTLLTVDMSEASFAGNTLVVNGPLYSGGYSGSSSSRGGEGILLLPDSLETFSTGGLTLGQNSGGGAAVTAANPTFAIGEIDFGGGSELSANISGDFVLGRGDNVSGTLTNLPSALHLTIGDASDRVVAHVAYKNQSQPLANHEAVGFVVSNGGTFEAHLTELRIGQNTIDTGDPGTSGGADGLLDFSAATLSTLDIAGDALIGVGVNAEGDLRLAGGEAVSQSLTLSSGQSGSSGRLDLDGTLWTIGDILSVGAGGQANVMVGLTSAGFDLTSDEAFQFDIAMGGVIEAPFEELVQAWAVRMLGDQTTLFDQYVGDGRLVASGTYGSYAEVFFDGTHTVFGIIPEPGVVSLILVGLGSLLLGRRCPCRRAQ